MAYSASKFKHSVSKKIMVHIQSKWFTFTSSSLCFRLLLHIKRYNVTTQCYNPRRLNAITQGDLCRLLFWGWGVNPVLQPRTRNSTSSRENPLHNIPKAIHTHQPYVCRLQNPWDDPKRKAAASLISSFATDKKSTWLPPSSIGRNKPICWRNGYSMAWRRGHSRHCLLGFRQSIWLSKSSSST